MQDQVIVQKFGGTSLKDLQAIENCVSIVTAAIETGKKVVAVVSAMGAYTDELLSLCHQVSQNPPKREVDMLLTTGERISSALFSICLDQRNVKSVSLTGSQSGIITDDVHGNAKIKEIRTERLYRCLERYNVVVIAGFQGVSAKTKDITTLGRGGSDLTAVALAHALEASACEIYTDVDGVFTLDPRIYNNAKLIKSLSWEQMYTLSANGAGVLHHRAALLAQKFRVPIQIRSSFKCHHRGTTVQQGQTLEDPAVVAISYREKQAFLIVEVKADPCSYFYSVLEWLWQREVFPLLCQQSQLKTDSIRYTLLLSETLAIELAERIRESHYWCCDLLLNIQVIKKLGSICLMGQGFRVSPLWVGKLCRYIDMDYKYLDIQDNSILLVLCQDKLSEGLQLLHEKLIEKDIVF